VTQLASQTTVSGAELNSRPVASNTEILEAAPGLAVVQHSGSGEANQYYLRGYNLDHGTDLTIFWDDVPINLPTNAHGQGYADLNFLIPETLAGMEVRKGLTSPTSEISPTRAICIFSCATASRRTSCPRPSAASATTGS
jgi:outer membrane cobalamin receptor